VVLTCTYLVQVNMHLLGAGTCTYLGQVCLLSLLSFFSQ
jgi:hypothetical protein